MTKKPRIASVDDPTILAAVRGYFRWEHDLQAREMLAKIHETYIRSKEQDDCTDSVLSASTLPLDMIVE